MNTEECAEVGQRDSSLQRDKTNIEMSSDLMRSFGSKIEHFL